MTPSATPADRVSLNDEQRHAIASSGSTVVLAGPGSGKTETIVLKIAGLLRDDLPSQRGVACLTYGNDAVREFTQRLRHYGFHSGHRLFLGTVHSFCMQRVLRPFADLCGRPDLADPRVLSSNEQLRVRQKALDQCHVGEDARYFEPTLTTIRRAIACEEDLSRFDDRHVVVARSYNALLATLNAVDFEAMTLGALELLETHADLCDLLVARYPWIAIDEYQDLGGPLHRVVLLLHEAGCRIFAVGDPDQCIFGFTGADPMYLNELVGNPDFTPITLKFNYRSGSRLVAAAQATLTTPRPYQADPSRDDPGRIDITEIDGEFRGQAQHVVHQLVPDLLQSGVAPEQIAVLYNRKGAMLDALVTEIDTSADDYLIERDLRFPSSPIVRWLQQCATRVLDPDHADSLADLIAHHPIREHSRLDEEADLAVRGQLFRALRPANPTEPLDAWVTQFDAALHLTHQLAQTNAHAEDVDSIRLLGRPVDPPIQLAEFARGVQVTGRVVVTTCHAAKGRQFDAVIIPGLQRTLFPFERWIGGSYRPTDLAGDRRLFYVGITRARHQVHLIHSPRFTNQNGYPVIGRSPFLDELEQRLVRSA